MNQEKNYKPQGLKEYVSYYLSKATVACARKWPECFLPPDSKDKPDIYASSMTENFNSLHKAIFTRFYKKIQVENLEALKNVPRDGVIIYATKEIGQLEYNFFNFSDVISINGIIIVTFFIIYPTPFKILYSLCFSTN